MRIFRMHSAIPIIFAVLFLLGANVSDVSACNGSNQLLTDEFLSRNASLCSDNGMYELKFQNDENLVLKRYGSPIWATGTRQTGAEKSHMQPDGNFVITDANIQKVWSTGTDGNLGAELTLQDDGDITIKSSGGNLLWQSDTAMSAKVEIDAIAGTAFIFQAIYKCKDETNSNSWADGAVGTKLTFECPTSYMRLCINVDAFFQGDTCMKFDIQKKSDSNKIEIWGAANTPNYRISGSNVTLLLKSNTNPCDC